MAYGNVKQIIKSVEKILSLIAGSPHDFINSTSKKDWVNLLSGFKHRFATGEDIVNLFSGISFAVREYSSVQNLLISKISSTDLNVLPALCGMVAEMEEKSGVKFGHLVPSPERGSACKRLLLYLKWMVRHDDVDPGGWEIDPSMLVIPLDTHMYYITSKLGFTKRKSADLKTAIEVTEQFKKIIPSDPAKYDFALTRLGIKNELNRDEFINHVLGLTNQ